MSSPEKSTQVLQEVEQAIKSFPFKFKGVKILSGKEEGAYGWVTVNYLLENFIKVSECVWFLIALMCIQCPLEA